MRDYERYTDKKCWHYKYNIILRDKIFEMIISDLDSSDFEKLLGLSSRDGYIKNNNLIRFNGSN